MTANNVSTSEHRYRSFGLSENPFHISPDPRFLFSGQAYALAIAELQKGIESRRGLMVLTGEAGTGKTTLMRYFLQWLAERRVSTSYIFHAHLDAAGLFEFILRDFGVPVDSTRKTDLIARLHRWLATRDSIGDAPVVVIDEAQALPVRTLSELSLLLNLEGTNGKLVQVVLAGQPELDEKLRRPDLHALRQRIAVRCRLPLLSLEETAEYIQARLDASGTPAQGLFPDETIHAVYSYARGIPRVINLLCEHALDFAYGEGRPFVAPSHVRKAAAEFDLGGESYSSFDLDLPPRSKRSTPPPFSEVTPRPAIPMVIEVVTPLGEPLAGSMPLASPSPPQPEAVAKAAAAVPASESVTTLPAMQEHEAQVQEIETTSVRALAKAATAAVAAHAATNALPAAAAKPAGPKPGLVEFCLAPVAKTEEPKLASGYEWKKNPVDAEWRSYWRDVSTTFRRDFRHLAQSIGPALKSVPQNIVSGARNAKQKIFEPFRKWLRTPISRAARDAQRAASESHPAERPKHR